MPRTKKSPGNKESIGYLLTSMNLLTVIPMSLVKSILEKEDKLSKRERKLPAHVLVMLIIFMSIYSDYNTSDVFAAMCSTLFPEMLPDRRFDVGEVAISQARQRLGDEVLKKLFLAVCRPMTTNRTQGAWYRQWRIMAVDGSDVDLPDEAKIREKYPKHSNDKSDYPFPQLKYAALQEIGSRAYTSVAIGNDLDSEMSLAARVENDLEPDMLVIADRYYVGVDNIKRVNDRGAACLFRARGNLKLKPVKRLKDGSYTAVLKKSKSKESVLVRVIEYTVRFKGRKSCETIRLVTNILDPDMAPAAELASLYSSRWNIETGFREIKSTLRMKQKTLRSKKPELAQQEFWGVLLAHYIVKRVIHDAAVANGRPPSDISTKATIHVIKQFAKGKLFSPTA